MVKIGNTESVAVVYEVYPFAFSMADTKQIFLSNTRTQNIFKYKLTS